MGVEREIVGVFKILLLTTGPQTYDRLSSGIRAEPGQTINSWERVIMETFLHTYK